MKKLLILILALVMCLTAFTACDFSFLTPVEPEVEYHIEKAETFLKNMYKDDNTVTGADYEVTGQVRVAGVAYTVTWTVNTDKVTIEGPVTKEDGTVVYTVNVDEKSAEEVAYTLTATITAGNGDTATVTFERTVPVYNVLSWDAYMAAEKGDTVLVEGIVVAMNAKSLGNSRNHLFLADASGKGGYYSYQMDQDPVEAGVKVGMTVSVTGPIEPYSGMQEIKGGTFAIVDETIKTVNPVDITDFILAGGTNFSEYVALPVTIKGVTIGSQELETTSSQYLYFELNGVKSYVRTYVTDFPTTLDAKTATAENADKAAIDKAHADHYGYKADVTGILILYSNNPYLIPMSTDCFTNFVEVTYTDEEKVNAELDALTLDSAFASDTVVDLLTTGKYYSDVTITWTSDNTNAVVADGKLTITVPDEAVTANITVTVTCGEVTKTKVFEVKLSKDPISVTEALELADGANVYVAGEVIKINTAWSDTYGNISVTISDGTNTLYVFRLATNVTVGDVVEITGVMATYNGSRQIAAGATAVITDPAPVEATVAEAVALDDGRRVIVTGTVTEIKTAYSETYNNISIILTDANGDTLYVFRLTGNVEVGDQITITGKVGSYNGSKQIAAGATYEVVTENNGPAEVTVTEALELADDTEVVVSGEVVEINTAWSDTYGNISVTISDGTNTLYVFRLATNVTVGDVVEITGVMATYNGSRQIAAGATAVITDPAPVEATVAEAIALDDGRRVIVTGTVTEIKTAYSETYNNISIILTDANGDTLYVFRLTGNVEVGDQITITGKVGSYNGSKQIAAGATAEITGHVNMLLVGDTNKIVITDAINNGYDYYIVWVAFTADETANYAFVGEGLVIWVYDATVTTELTGYTGAAELAAGTYCVCIAANTTLTTGTYNVAVTKTAISTGDETTTTATFAPADLGFTSSTEFTGPFALDSAISISAKDNDGENPPKYYNATSDVPATLRVYSKDDLTVTAADGYKIVKVVITAHSSKTISGVDKFDASVEGTATFESYVYTLTLSEASSAVTITMGGQVRIVGIEVVYEAE